MSKNNKIHFFLMKNRKIKYICNKSCSISKNKITNDYFKVTCKKCKKILDKEKPTKKQQEKSKQEFRLKFLKDNLENKKRVYNVYIDALVKYNMSSLPYAAIMTNEHLINEVHRKMKICRKGKESFIGSLIDKPDKSEEEKIKHEIDYYDSLIKHTQGRFSMMEDKIKTRIAKDSIEQSVAWLKLVVENSKLNKDGGKK